MNTKVKIINQLTDNYSYVIYSKESKKALILDPSEPKKIIKFLESENLELIGILITHHHNDHTQGVEEILNKYNVDVYTPNNKIKGTTNLISHGEIIDFDFVNFNIIDTPGHTLDHIVFYSEGEKLLFSGDTLFGCGRVFEGTYQQMLNSLNKLKLLPDETMIYCGHEYTYKNLEFTINELTYFSDKNKILSDCKKNINKYGSSMPFNLGYQKKWNPFLRCNDPNFKNEIANFTKNQGKIAPEANELEYFTFIREKRNKF